MGFEMPIVTVTLNPAIDRTLSIEHFSIGKVNRVTADQSHAAGKGVNVAMMLADLGASVIATGFLGDGNARVFETAFASKTIEDRFVRLSGETRVGLKIVDGGQTTDINFPGLTPSAAAQQSLSDLIASLAIAGRWFVLCGSIPAGAEANIYARLIETIHRCGGRVLLDTSGASLAPALAAKPDIVKPNVAELSELAGKPLSEVSAVVSTARSLLIDKGVKLAVVSMGGDGAVFLDRENALLAEPAEVAVRSTVGAGDAMVAGIVFARSQGWTLEETATLASSLGTYAVTRIGSGLERPDAYRPFAPRLKRLA